MSPAAASDVAGTVFEDDQPEATRSYAEALLGAAAKEGQVDAVLDELDAIASDVLGANPRFAAILGSPSTPAAEKDRILVDAFEGRALPTIVRFLRVLNRHGRLGLVGPIARAARAIWDRRQGRRAVAVRSAAPLDDAQQEALRDRLAAMLDATPVISLTVDPSLIGGLVVQVGDDVYDASVRNRLEQFRRHLVEGKLSEVRARSGQYTVAD
jgi:F-type H+-transporting ATPase subunit delta